jgi:threonylcarbamoyladenosine tRNA methylthiotransferase MtaB
MYTATGFQEIVDKVRSRYPDFNFTTDVIVGFPGETDEDFQQTVDFSRKIGFGHIHTFKYSVRNGTRAERMPEQISEKLKTRRSEIIRLVGEEEKRRYRLSMIGKQQTVLVEKVIGGIAQGYGENYLPVKFPAEGVSSNEFVKVVLIALENGDDPFLIGKRVIKSS